jgi:hypothetical protein
MEFVSDLGSRINSVRDGYTTSAYRRRGLYLYAKENEDRLRNVPSVKLKLGAKRHAWVVGLIEFGDDNGWFEQAVKERAEERRRGRDGRSE